MKTTSLAGVAIAGVIIAAGIALAGNSTSSKHEDYASAGVHQFYVWCSGTPDFKAIARGRSAEDAQMKLYEKIKRTGRTTCWPVWQGRLSG